jgi:hypothetical protein
VTATSVDEVETIIGDVRFEFDENEGGVPEPGTDDAVATSTLRGG